METSQWIALSAVAVAAAGIVWGPWRLRRAQRVEREQQQRDEWRAKAAPGVQATRSLMASRTPTVVELHVFDGPLAEELFAELTGSDNERWRQVRDILGEVEVGHPSQIVRARCRELKLAVAHYLSHVHAVLMTGTVGEEERTEELAAAVSTAADDLVDALHERAAA